jgi:CubicO group peptidase (beta-lactamase class C family)
MAKTRICCSILSMMMALANFSAPVSAGTGQASAVDGIFSRWNSQTSPGCAVGVYLNDELAFARGYGMANLELQAPITPDTAFEIGSTSKQFTAAAIILLAQEGKLSLDDDIRKYVPEIPDYGTPITIEMLLRHTSGLRDFVTLLMFADVDFDDVSRPAQALSILSRQKALNYSPGTQYLYSNSGYFTAGLIVERVSGQSLRQFAQQRIFGPLGMRNTYFKDDHAELVPRRASGYSEEGSGRYKLSQPNWEQVGDGGVVTTVGDLLFWQRNFSDPKLGGAGFVAEMLRTGTLADGQPMNYASGLMVDDHNGLKMIHHGGSWGGYRAEVVRFPARNLSVSALCNSSNIDASALAIQVADLWLAGDAAPAERNAVGAAVRSGFRHGKPKRTVPVARERLLPLVGAYRNPRTGSLRFIDLKGDTLWLEGFGGRSELRPTSGDSYELVDGPFEAGFSFRKGSTAPGLVLHQLVGGKESTFNALKLDAPTPQELNAFAGNFRCDELGMVYRLEGVDGALQRVTARGEVERFRPLERGEFNYGNLTMKFRATAQNGYDAIVLDIGRVRGLVCPRE